MGNRLPLGLIVLASLQFIGPLLLPIDTLERVPLGIWGVVAALFVLLGFSLLRRRAWSRVATIFVQGFNIIVRILYLTGHAVTVERGERTLNGGILGLSLLSVVVSGLILYYIDLPDVQIVMQ